jgi:hypothetical protein
MLHKLSKGKKREYLRLFELKEKSQLLLCPTLICIFKNRTGASELKEAIQNDSCIFVRKDEQPL